MDHLVRNADGDELLFVHAGEGRLFCDYGHLEIRGGDYVVLPRSTMWRLEPAETMRMLLIEATNGSYQLPDRGLGPNDSIFFVKLVTTCTNFWASAEDIQSKCSRSSNPIKAKSS